MNIRDGRLAGLRYQYAKLARWITIDSDQRFKCGSCRGIIDNAYGEIEAR